MTTIIISAKDGSDIYMKGSGAGTALDPFIPENNIRETGSQKDLVFRKLDSVGDGTGITNQNVDGSITPVSYLIKPGAGEVYRISKLMMYVRDNTSLDSGGWGGLTALVNGITVHTVLNSIQTEWLQTSLKSHGDLAAVSGPVVPSTFGTGDEFLVADWKFTDTGQFVRLDGALGDELVVVINDDLTGLVEQSVYAQGYIE